MLIRGAAGLGKSTLLAEAEAMARRRGARVYHGASAVAGQSLPLGPLLDALMDTDDLIALILLVGSYRYRVDEFRRVKG